MTAKQTLEELKTLGSEGVKKIFLKHGAKEPLYGVKVEDLKKLQKKLKSDHSLALELYSSGIGDAMYLAGLMANGPEMSKKQLQDWAEKANWSMISEYSVAWVAAESKWGWELALEWINSPKENIASAGWSTLSSIVSIKQDSELNITELKKLLIRVQKEIHKAQNRVCYTMNGFVIAVGGFVWELTDMAIKTAQNIGEVTVDVGGTACKVPAAADYINKMKQKGSIGKKRKTAKC
jgi:3-methyladenine DNA glycosylase AlkD